jgi:hypothetical protein
MSVSTPGVRTRSVADFARTILRADGALCAASGVLLLAGAGPIASLAGLDGPLGVVAVGAFLLPWGAGLLWLAGRRPVGRGLLLTVAVVNILWVIGSAAIILGGTPALSTLGTWGVALVADVVALLALAQLYAFRRLH